MPDNVIGIVHHHGNRVTDIMHELPISLFYLVIFKDRLVNKFFIITLEAVIGTL